MSTRNLSNLEIEAVNSELTENILENLRKPVSNRTGFEHNNYTVTIPRHFYRLIGIKNDEDEYYDSLYRLNRELSNFGSLYIKFDKGINKNIGSELKEKLNLIISKSSINGSIDTSSLIRYINEYGVIDSGLNSVLSLQMKNNFKGILDYYIVSGNNNLEILKSMIIYTIHWINIYVKTLFSNFKYDDINPKVLFYGEISREEVFFLTLLSTLGCDILYFNPQDSVVFEAVDKANVFSKKIAYSKKAQLKDFPETLRERVKTTAYTAREELNKTLFSEGSNFYRPWQFTDYRIEAVTLRTTYEEVNIWSKEKAMIRDGWRVENGTVFIPNIFAKINGTHGNIDKYWKEVNEILNQKNTKFYIDLPILDIVPLEYGKLEQVYPSRFGSQFDTEKLLKAPWWKFKELRYGLQRNMAERIKELCLDPVVKSPENVDLRDIQVDIFSVLINLDMKHLQILQGFDYPDEVPKIIIYNNEQNGNISYEDSILLTFMNAMGVDILIYNPSGYIDIEEYVHNGVYDIHHLEERSFNLTFKKYTEKKGFFKNLFKFK
jgi:hypothetical protein